MDVGDYSGKEFIISPAAKDSKGVYCVKAITPIKKQNKTHMQNKGKNQACAREYSIYSYLLRILEYVIIPWSKKFQVGVFPTEASLTEACCLSLLWELCEDTLNFL